MKLVISRFHPYPDQNMPTSLSKLFVQYSWFWMWSALWLLFSLQGVDPIRIDNPTVVNNETGRLMQD